MASDDSVMNQPMQNLSHAGRKEHVLRMLEIHDSVQVSELAELFAVSEVTIRNDLAALAREGLVMRVRGGAQPLLRGQSELDFDHRLRLQAEEKQAIARAAATFVAEGDSVALDSSTTAYYLALELRVKRELVVVTNGLRIAAALADAPGVTVVVTGGVVRAPAMSLVGEVGANLLRTTQISMGFVGARGLSIERGLMDLNPDEARTKQHLVAACDRVIGIFDRTKWKRSALLSFVDAARVHAIVTDTGAPAEDVHLWRARGVEVVTVEPPARGAALIRPRDLSRMHLARRVPT